MTTTFAFDPPPRPVLPVIGRREVFPVNRIFCVGQNYADHAREMGANPVAANAVPVFFSKPADSLAHDGDAIPFPPMTQDLHHEVELVVAIGRDGRDIAPEKAHQHVFGYAVGLDLTRRDLQQQAKKEGKPWDLGKGFDHAAPVGAILPVSAARLPLAGAIQLSVNGELRQDGRLEDMIFPVEKLISILSRFMTLRAGDILMTGTPAGVSALRPGDKIDAHIAAVGDLSVTIRAGYNQPS